MSSNRHPPTQLTPYVLRTPKLALGYLGNVVTASPESVQFWQELGVGPVGGPKDITSFSLYIGDDGSEARDNIDLVKHIGTAYEVRWLCIECAVLTCDRLRSLECIRQV